MKNEMFLIRYRVPNKKQINISGSLRFKDLGIARQIYYKNAYHILCLGVEFLQYLRPYWAKMTYW